MRSLNERFSDTKLSNSFRFSDILSKFFAQLFLPQIQPNVSRGTFFSVLLSRRRSRPLAANAPAALRRRGGQYTWLEPIPFIFCTHLIRIYTPAFAKPPVSRWHLSAFPRKNTPIFGCLIFDVSMGLAPTIAIFGQYHETLAPHNILNVIMYRIHIRFYYTTFSANAARQNAW